MAVCELLKIRLIEADTTKDNQWSETKKREEFKKVLLMFWPKKSLSYLLVQAIHSQFDPKKISSSDLTNTTQFIPPNINSSKLKRWRSKIKACTICNMRSKLTFRLIYKHGDVLFHGIMTKRVTIVEDAPRGI